LDFTFLKFGVASTTFLKFVNCAGIAIRNEALTCAFQYRYAVVWK
jgi:hypothetical protein